jgi:hypothetical protein
MDAVRLLRLASVGMALAIVTLGATANVPAVPIELFEAYGDDDKEFEEVEIGHMRVYFHQREIEGAIVEKDYIVYQLDERTGELLARKSHWREDVSGFTSGELIPRERAEEIAGGEARLSSLYLISPESDVFRVYPTPRNPCWIVRSVREHGRVEVLVIDAVAAAVVGHGVPPPYDAFSLTGPWYFEPCSGSWDAWSGNAAAWFDAMGYSTEEVEWPTQSKVQSHVQSHQTAMFYELAHGGSSYFASGCTGGYYAEYTTASEIESWIAGYEKMPFAFIGSCDGMAYTGDGTFAYEFRKGSGDNTTVVGYAGMSEPQCDVCWTYSLNWQTALFGYMNSGYAVKDAFDQANADYPVCANSNCMRFAGDEDFAVCPPVNRVWIVVSGRLQGSQVQLTWSPVESASAYWVCGASNLAYFTPGGPPGYVHRLAVVPQGTTTWSSAGGVGDPASNWTYLVMAVDATGAELARSERVGEHDFAAAVPQETR